MVRLSTSLGGACEGAGLKASLLYRLHTRSRILGDAACAPHNPAGMHSADVPRHGRPVQVGRGRCRPSENVALDWRQRPFLEFSRETVERRPHCAWPMGGCRCGRRSGSACRRRQLFSARSSSRMAEQQNVRRDLPRRPSSSQRPGRVKADGGCPRPLVARRTVRGVLCLAALLGAAATASSASADLRPSVQTPREAYVSLLYGNFYVLPLRTLMRSLIDNSPDVASAQRERVVIVTGTTSDETVGQLRSDGITVLRIPTVRTPYADDPRFDARFANVMTKLAIFNLTQYDRVAFVDADALVLRDMSDIFRCGRFCAVFINPCHFNSGLMLVTPSTDTFNDMLRQLPHLPSYDGGDQGFLNAYYPQMLTAPMFDPQAEDVNTSQVDFVRLPFTFHMDHSAYYPRFRWDHSSTRCGGAVREEEWLGPSFAKPWLWYTYAIFDQSWVWHEYRSKLDDPYPQGTQTSVSAGVIMAFCYAVFVPLLVWGHGLQHYIATVLPALSPFASVSRRCSLVAALALGSVLWSAAVGIAAYVIPPLLPPRLAFCTFAHVRSTLTFLYLVFALGSVACCGQRATRGLAKLSPRAGAPHAAAPTLRSIMSECAAWAVADGLLVILSGFAMWQIKFDNVMSKMLFIGGYLAAQGLLTFAMLFRASSLWLAWATTLPPLPRA